MSLRRIASSSLCRIRRNPIQRTNRLINEEPIRESLTLPQFRTFNSSHSLKVNESSDVVIVGGGVVGLALACSLAENATFTSAGNNITLIEASSLDKLRSWSSVKQNKGSINDWENRAIYLTEENRTWLSNLGIESHLLKNRTSPVHSMHVTDGLTGAALNFDVPNPNDSQLGTMVEISNLQQAMLKRLEILKSSKGASIRIIDGAKVESVEALLAGQIASTYTDAWPLVHLSNGMDPIKARLLVGADGNNSPVRKYAGIKAQGWPYGRMGLVGTVKCEELSEEMERIAYQRFLPTGTIAWLPLSSDSASIVWTLPPNIAKALSILQKQHESNSHLTDSSPISLLITAAFRLPWDILSPILTRLASEASLEEYDSSWLVSELEEKLMMSSIEQGSGDNFPPPAKAILKGSVAGFPLKLSHAEAYLGSSLRQISFSEAGAGALLPSTILQKAIETFSSIGSTVSGANKDAVGEEDLIPRGRTALIGDAAHTIHPLAGQGLNLGLADSRSLSDTLIKAISQGADLGNHLSLQSYPRERYLANQAMLSAVDHLHWLFVTPSPPGNPSNSIFGDLISRATIWGRSTGFEVLNEMDMVKKAIIGAAGSSKRSS